MNSRKKIISLMIISSSFLSIFISLILFSSFISAQNSAAEKISESFISFFTDWSHGKASANIAKIFLLFIVSIVVYLALSSFSIFQGNKTLVMVLSFLIGFLATAYFTPKEVYSLLNSYDALGLTISALIPFFVLMGLSFRAVQDGNPSQILFQWIAWGAFAAFSVYRFVYDFFWAHEGSKPVNSILLAMAILSLVMFIFNERIISFFRRRFLEAIEESARETSREAAMREVNLAASQEIVSNRRSD